MKTIEAQTTETWEHGKWSEYVSGAVSVHSPRDGWHNLKHERDIPSDWPDKVKDAVRREIQANRELAANEVRYIGGGIGAMRIKNGSVLDLGNGVEQDREGLVRMATAKTTKATEAFWQRALDYFDKHALADDEAITHDGRRVKFCMRNDGEAEAQYSSGAHCTDTKFPRADEYVPFFEKLIAYRDRERSKWKPEWRVEWVDAGAVQIFKNETMVDVVDAKGRTTDDDIPDHILAQARAKFRENYQLRRDEIWFQGMPVRMEFERCAAVPEGRVVTSNSECDWYQEPAEANRADWHTIGVTFADESERLEAYDRMRRFYYEEHPGKCLHGTKGPLGFVMIDGVGHAVHRNSGTVWRSDHPKKPTYPESEYTARAKLKRWTEVQLTKSRLSFESVRCDQTRRGEPTAHQIQSFELKDVYMDHEGYLRKKDGGQLFYGAHTEGEHEAAEAFAEYLAKVGSCPMKVRVTIELGEEP